MFSSEESETISHLDNEQINQFDDYDAHLMSECFSREECSVISISPKWRKTPRTIAYFSESKSSISSCRDSDYEAWLQNYYQELQEEHLKQSYIEKGVDTSDLVDKKPDNVFTSLFSPVEKNVWSYSTKYWGPKDIRRHWPLRKKKGEYLLLPSIHPHLNLRSRYGRFHSLLNSASAVPEFHHKNTVCCNFKKVLKSIEVLEPQLQKLMICDTLCNLKWFDHLTKTAVTKSLCRFFRTQYRMEKLYLENTNFDRLEGITLLCALSRNGGGFVKELHAWKMFGYGQCPLLLNELSGKGELKPTKEKFSTKIHYLQILNKFSSLTHLSINYAYLANRKGDALLCLKCIRFGNLKELRFLCTMDERPLRTNPGYGVGGWKIADGVWKRAVEYCPDLRVSFVFLNMPQYENVILFLSKSIPVSYIYLSSGIDFNFEVPWDIDSTLLELRNWYGSTLETLCIHLWRHKDLLDYVIKCKILDEFPNLLHFEFIGVLEDVETLEAFCCQLLRGIYIPCPSQGTSRQQMACRQKEAVETVWVVANATNPGTECNDTDNGIQGPATAICLHIPPYVHYIIKDDTVVLQGSFGQLWNILEERLGFSSEYMIESYNTGVLNFQNKRRDVLLRPSVISSDDVDSFDFTYPIGSTWYELYLKDSDEINSSHSYVRNWSMGIWMFTVFMIFFFTVLLYIMLHLCDKFSLRNIYILPSFEGTYRIIQYLSLENNKFSLPKNWRKIKRDNQKLRNKNDKSLGNCFISAISVFCSQGVYLQTTVTSVRLSMLSFWIFGMIMYNSYSALLVSQLTLGEQFLPFETLEEIPLKAKEYALCVRPESYPYLYFTVNSSRNNLQKKWENIINREPCPSDGRLSLQEMCQPYVAFLEAPAVMKESILNNENCKMTNLKGRYFHVNFSLMILKGFEENAKKELNMEVTRYREVGILSYLEEKWIRRNKLPPGSNNPKLQVTFEHIKGILLVYVFCLGFCCSLFIIEILCYLKRPMQTFLNDFS